MLISSGMKYDLWMVQIENHTYALFHTNITNDRDKIDVRIFLLKLQTDVMKGTLGRIKQY